MGSWIGRSARPVVLALALLLAGLAPRDEIFRYDAPGRSVAAALLDGPELYAPDLIRWGGGLWLTWLEFVPGKGDHLWVGRRGEDGWDQRERVSAEPGRYARPTLTVDAGGALHLSYEAQPAEGAPWRVVQRTRLGKKRYSEERPVSLGTGNAVRHRVAAGHGGGLWFVWQEDRGGQWDVVCRALDVPGQPGGEEVMSASPRGDWSPSVAVGPDGAVCVAWDGHGGGSFDVFARWRTGSDEGEWGPVHAVARGPAFQGRPQLAADSGGRTWLLWEEGAEGWGAPYRSVEGLWNNATDASGPVHRLRRLRLGVLGRDGALAAPREPLPMPSLDRARTRTDARPGVRDLGVFYERGELCVDGRDRPWVVYRHYDEPQLGRAEPVVHHVEEGWRLYARCLGAEGWSELTGFDVPQRDGLQRLAAAAGADGVHAAWTTGRTDRREDPRPRGVAFARAAEPRGERPGDALLAAPAPAGAPELEPLPARTEAAEVGGERYELFFGDLHRHTDLSLCFPFLDGSVEDAYRYATEVARLDFLGITDHTRDVDRGDVQSQLWWRCAKEVGRHSLGGSFFPYFAFERSHRDTDHNVISLRSDVLRNFPPPLPDYWSEIGGDTFTIPHNPLIGRLWEHHDDAKRPLLEIYQGCRDASLQEGAHRGLDRGYHLGFIASSDHLSTGASFACVWAPRADREAIFRSMKARRTYAATDRIRLVFRSGGHWMGERFASDSAPSFQVEVQGTAALDRMDCYWDGELAESRADLGGGVELKTTWSPRFELTGEHYAYVHVVQADGNQAWSSPIWVRPPE